MITTYIGTLRHNDLTKCTFEMHMTDICKYNPMSQTVKVDTWKNVTGWQIITEEDATKLEKDMDEYSIDPCHEYCRLMLENGETATYNNSMVDMFIFSTVDIVHN